jgi:hypothetical protein
LSGNADNNRFFSKAVILDDELDPHPQGYHSEQNVFGKRASNPHVLVVFILLWCRTRGHVVGFFVRLRPRFYALSNKNKGRPLPALLRLLALAVALEGPLLQKVRYKKQTTGDKHG